MKKVFLWVTGIVVAVAVYLYFWGGGELTEQDKQAVNKAYTACAHKVDEAANELEKRYMSYSDGPTEEAAEELIGKEAKWRIGASEEECEEYARSVVHKHLSGGTGFEITDDYKLLTIEVWWEPQVRQVRDAWEEEEKKLAGETQCPNLHVKEKVRNDKWDRETNALDDKTFYENLRKEMFKALQRLNEIEPYRQVGAEVAGAVGGVVGGIGGAAGGAVGRPGWGKVGGKIGTSVGALVGALVGSKLVDWIADPAGDIQKILDNQVRKMAQERKIKFHDTMMKELEARRKEWERHIRWER